MKASYDMSKKDCCDCKCEECFEDDNSEIEGNRVLKVVAAAVLLMSVLFVMLSIVAIFGG